MRIAAWQGKPVTGGLGESLECLDKIATQAKEQGADILVTPEMYLSGYNIGTQAVGEAAHSMAEKGLSALSDLARQNNLCLLVGYPELNDKGQAYNAAALFGRNGDLLSNYRKSHLFGEVDRAQFTAGDSLSPLIELDGWSISLGICYDIEFPEVARSYALAGADLVLVPTANMLPFDGVATRLVPARSEENSLFMVYANYCGNEGDFHYCGLSCICGPDGEDLARAGRGEELIVAELKKDALRSVRENVRYLADRRPGLYSKIQE
ncbi:MAG: carbon-nitrogen hydrolase family protein [Pseudomonadota bacterium]